MRRLSERNLRCGSLTRILKNAPAPARCQMMQVCLTLLQQPELVACDRAMQRDAAKMLCLTQIKSAPQEIPNPHLPKTLEHLKQEAKSASKTLHASAENISAKPSVAEQTIPRISAQPAIHRDHWLLRKMSHWWWSVILAFSGFLFWQLSTWP